MCPCPHCHTVSDRRSADNHTRICPANPTNVRMEQDRRSSRRRLNQTSSNPITSYLRPRRDATNTQQEPANGTASPIRTEGTTCQTLPPDPTPSIPTSHMDTVPPPRPPTLHQAGTRNTPTADLKFSKRIRCPLLPTNDGDI